VDPEQRGQLVLLQEAGRLDIRRDHALLDQPVRVVSRIGADLGRVAVRINQHLDLGRLEIQRAALLTLLAQRLVDEQQAVDDRRERRLLAPSQGSWPDRCAATRV
jgi:hypothetical protein